MGLLDETLSAIGPTDPSVRSAARKRLSQLTMPHWALGRLMDLADDLAAITGHLRPVVARKLDKLGLGLDFLELEKDLKDILAPYDHRHLNEIAPFDEHFCANPINF